MSTRKSKEERRRELLMAARDVFVDRGFSAATIDDIVAAAGVARGTFYLYYPDKRAAFEALADDFLARIVECVKSIELGPDVPPPRVQLRANIARVADLALSDPAWAKLALFDATGLDPALDARLDGYYAGLRELVAESLEQGQALSLVREGDHHVMVAIGLGGLKEVLFGVVSGELDADAETITEEIMRFLSGGLLTGAVSGV